MSFVIEGTAKFRPQEIAIGIASGLLAALAGLAIIAVVAEEAANGLVVHFFFGAVAGISFAWLFRPLPLTYAESMMSGLAFGLLLWVILSLNLIPIAMGEGPQWEVEAAASAFPALTVWLVEGAVIGVALDWTVDLFFPRDIVQTATFRRPTKSVEAGRGMESYVGARKAK